MGLMQRILHAGGVNAVTEDAASPSPGVTWNGILGALRQGNTPDGAAALDGGGQSPILPSHLMLIPHPFTLNEDCSLCMTPDTRIYTGWWR